MMIAEARLRSESVTGAATPAAQPVVRKKRLAASALAVGIVAVLLLVLGYMAIVIVVAHVVSAAVSSD
jgi:hypothetical protein